MQRLRCPEGPIRIAQKFAREQHQVGASVSDNVIGLHGFGDHAHGRGRNPGSVPDPLGQRNLVTGADRNLGERTAAARTAINQIDASPL